MKRSTEACVHANLQMRSHMCLSHTCIVRSSPAASLSAGADRTHSAASWGVPYRCTQAAYVSLSAHVEELCDAMSDWSVTKRLVTAEARVRSGGARCWAASWPASVHEGTEPKTRVRAGVLVSADGQAMSADARTCTDSTMASSSIRGYEGVYGVRDKTRTRVAEEQYRCGTSTHAALGHPSTHLVYAWVDCVWVPQGCFRGSPRVYVRRLARHTTAVRCDARMGASLQPH